MHFVIFSSNIIELPIHLKKEIIMAGIIPELPFKGVNTALITPFKDGQIDKAALVKIVNWQIEQGVHGLVPVGTTGESPTLSHEEHDEAIEITVAEAAGRVPVIAGAGSNNTLEAVRLAKHAEKVGADAVLIVSPYYNKPTQAGLKAHFTAIANELSSIPLIIYDIPGRSIVRVEDTLLAELAEHKNIVGIKDATGDAGRPARLCNVIGEEFCQLSGDDATAFSYLASGGHGMISVVSNIAPKLYADMYNAFSSGELKTGMALNKKLMPLHDGLFCEASPGPVKYAAERLGLCSSEVRLPLVSISADAKRVVDSALTFAGLM